MAKYSSQDRRDIAKKGHALPDGSFPIEDEEDLRNAISNWNLGKRPFVAKKFIIKRARQMNLFDVLPQKWKDQLQHEEDVVMTEDVDDFLMHFGIKGMKWGRRNSESKAREGRDHSGDTREQLTSRLTTLQARNQRMNAHTYLEGARAASLGGVRRTRRDGSVKTYWHTTNDTLNDAIAKGKIAAESAAVLGVVAGATALLVTKVPGSPSAKAGAIAAAGILGIKTGLVPGIKKIHSIDVYRAHDRRVAEIGDINRRLKALDKKK